MVEPGRSAGVREAKKSSSTSSSTAAAAMVKKKVTASKKRPEKEEKADKKQSMEPESPSYRLALKSLFSCRNSNGHGHAQNHHSRPRAQQDTGSRSKRLGCSAPSICKLRDDSESRHQRMQPVPPPPEETMGGTASAGEPCKRRASVSGSSERCVKKPLSEAKCGTGRSSSATASSSSNKQLQRGGSSLSSSSSSGGSSFRAGMQLRRLSGCYECHMVVDPVSGSTSMRATICPCPDCGEVFVRQESLHLHQSIRHAVSELGADDTSRNIIEIIFQSSWLKKQSPVCKVDRILKVHNTPRTLARFEEYRDAVKARAASAGGGHQQPVAMLGAKKTSTNNSSSTNRHPRCTADGNELLRFHCATLACSLGLNGATHLCDAAGAASGGCAACGIIRDGFSRSAGDGGVLTMATSGRAHDAVPVPVADGGGLGEEAERQQRRAMLVCRVIAGRVKRPKEEEPAASVWVSEEEEAADDDDADAEGEEEEEYDSVAGSAGVYSNLEELLVFNPRAILPCFVVVYKA